MDQNRCLSIKDALLARFAEELEVSIVGNQCIVTLPIKTLDDRYIDVFIEPITTNLVYVHDGGKNATELFSQGIHLTDKQSDVLKGIARRYDATFQNGRFQVVCHRESEIIDAVINVSQCASLAMVEVVSHEPKIEDELLSARVARSLNKWKPPHVDIQRRFGVKGRQTGIEHLFDFVAISRNAELSRNVAIKIIAPSFGSRVQAERYGFMVLDMGRKVAEWPRLAIVSKVEDWSDPALRLVRSLSTETIELETDSEERVETLLPGKMQALSEAA